MTHTKKCVKIINIKIKDKRMSQHFLLSSKARSLSIMNIVKMSDMEAFEMFKAIRFNVTNGKDIGVNDNKK